MPQGGWSGNGRCCGRRGAPPSPSAQMREAAHTIMKGFTNAYRQKGKLEMEEGYKRVSQQQFAEFRRLHLLLGELQFRNEKQADILRRGTEVRHAALFWKECMRERGGGGLGGGIRPAVHRKGERGVPPPHGTPSPPPPLPIFEADSQKFCLDAFGAQRIEAFRPAFGGDHRGIQGGGGSQPPPLPFRPPPPPILLIHPFWKGGGLTKGPLLSICFSLRQILGQGFLWRVGLRGKRPPSLR